jgi:hypothetical protein
MAKQKPIESPAQILGRLGGSANTPKQNAARRKNARRSAGRPGRVCLYCGEPVLGGHVDRALDETCGAHGWQWQQRANTPTPAAPSRDRKALMAIHTAVTAARGALAEQIRALLARVDVR